MDVGTTVGVLFVVGAVGIFLALMRRLPPAEDDVAAVVAAIVRTAIDIGRPPADLEEPVRWRLELLKPRVTDRSKRSEVAKPLTVATRTY